MKPRISLITICVDDLAKSLRFYRDGLGLPTEGIVGTEFEYGAVAFFDLEANLKLALWPRKSLARDTGLTVGKPSATEFSIGHNVALKEMGHNRPPKDRPIGLPARYASIPCSRQEPRRARPVQASRSSRVLGLRGTRIRWVRP